MPEEATEAGTPVIQQVQVTIKGLDSDEYTTEVSEDGKTVTITLEEGVEMDGDEVITISTEAVDQQVQVTTEA